MKKLLFLFLLLSSGAHAQNWFSADHRWVFNVTGGFGGFNEQFEMVAEADTVINGFPSRKWAFHTNGYFQLPAKYTRSDGPRAYEYAVQLDSFVKIYDFSLPVGSQVVIPREFGVFIYRIDLIDMVQAGDFNLKRQRVTYMFDNGQESGWHFDILENAGMVGAPWDLNYSDCSFVLIPDYQCGSVADGIDIAFSCFSTPAGSFNPFFGICSVVDVDTPDGPYMEVAPNPATDYVYIRLRNATSPLTNTTLIDLNGRPLRTWKGGNNGFSLQGIPAGSYFLAARFEDGQQVVKKVVKY